MGMFINPGYEAFRTKRNGLYVDKSGLISLINERINTPDKLVCVSRPRRFGKSTAAEMLSAYYDTSCDSSLLFNGLLIEKDPDYKTYMNKYNVLAMDMTTFIGAESGRNALDEMFYRVKQDINKAFPDISTEEPLVDMLADIVEETGKKIVAIIDEWDAIIRDDQSSEALKRKYMYFQRSMFKSISYTDKLFAAAYMTGILPIKKDGSQSAVSEFQEFTMIWPDEFQEFVGFTEDEVRFLCRKYNVDFGMMKEWYDGYSFDTVGSVYNPNSVMQAIKRGKFRSYWKTSSSSGSLLKYINMDFDKLNDAAWELFREKAIPINIKDFKNDISSLSSRDDVLTLLVHYGYLSYDEDSEIARIPNKEIMLEFDYALSQTTGAETMRRVQESKRLIEDTKAMNAGAVAAQIEKIHMEESSPLFYNNEQALRGAVKLAYFAYRDHYMKFEELPGGKGFADIVYLPKMYENYPVLIVELKCNDTPGGAIEQIRKNQYPDAIKGFKGRILLVGISYDKADKRHECKIEELEKS